MFPTEIYERILKYADGNTLLKAKCVCKQWKEITEFLEEKYNIWERCCNLDISKSILCSMQHKCGYVDDKHKWKVIYKNHIAWQNVRNKEYYVLQKQTIDFFENNITCAKISGSRIVYGNIGGIICVLNEEYEVEDVVITDIRGNLKDLIFVNKVKSSENTAYNHTHLIAVYEKHMLVFKLEPKIIQVAVVPQVAHVSVHNNIVAYSNFIGVVRVAELHYHKLGSEILEQISFCRIYSPAVIRSLCARERLVVLVTDSEVLAFDYMQHPASVARLAPALPFPFGLAESYWTFSTNTNIVFCTSSSYLYFSTVNASGAGNVIRKFNCMQSLGSPVCDILLYGNVLLFGMLDGKVYIYLVDDWAELELENYDMKLNVYGEPICSMDVQELEGEHRLLLTMNDYITQAFIY